VGYLGWLLLGAVLVDSRTVNRARGFDDDKGLVGGKRSYVGIQRTVLLEPEPKDDGIPPKRNREWSTGELRGELRSDLRHVPAELQEVVRVYGREEWLSKRFGGVRTRPIGVSYRKSLGFGNDVPVIYEDRRAIERRLTTLMPELPQVIRRGLYHCVGIRIGGSFETSFGFENTSNPIPDARMLLQGLNRMGKASGASHANARNELEQYCRTFAVQMERMRSRVWEFLRAGFVPARPEESNVAAVFMDGGPDRTLVWVFRRGEDTRLDKLLERLESLDVSAQAAIARAFAEQR